MRVRILVPLCLALLLMAGVTAAVGVSQALAASAQFVLPPSSQPSAQPTGQAHVAIQAGPPAPTLLIPANPSRITAPGTNFFGWALLDRRTNKMGGSANLESATTTTESMIKVWIAADYLRHHTQPSTAEVNDLQTMIVNSDDTIAHKYYKLNGGDPSITELTSVCKLSSTKPPSLANEWSYTTMSPADAARMGLCIADGQAIGQQKWTDWLLTAMRQVQGTVAQQQAASGGGRWGIIDALPRDMAVDTGIKNGWTAQVYDHNWHVNCLAVNPDWILAIEIHYPWTSPDGKWQDAGNLDMGAQTCASVTKNLIGTPDR
jgi:hypothetical protein